MEITIDTSEEHVWPCQFWQLSNEQNPLGCWGYILLYISRCILDTHTYLYIYEYVGDYTILFYRDYSKPMIRMPPHQPASYDGFSVMYFLFVGFLLFATRSARHFLSEPLDIPNTRFFWLPNYTIKWLENLRENQRVRSVRLNNSSSHQSKLRDFGFLDPLGPKSLREQVLQWEPKVFSWWFWWEEIDPNDLRWALFLLDAYM